jgi:3-deoxy-manno-octulosonate cytidylyltransferase (CMP-KDO synthetase)
MSAIVLIPARFGSVRFPGKPLQHILGRPMIQHVYERACRSKGIRDVFVATDDNRVYDAVRTFGGKVLMTSGSHKSGTDRIAEAVERLEETGYPLGEDEVIINVQGDEPLIDPILIEDLAFIMTVGIVSMATLAKRIEDNPEIGDPNVVKVVFDRNMDALYFSRSPIPYQRNEAVYYKHIGIYAYRRDFLRLFTTLPQGLLEKAEGLEQLRALEHGYKIRVVLTGLDTIGVDTPEDIQKVENWIRNSSS